MEEKIYQTRLSLNVQSVKKIEYIHTTLLPVIDEVRARFSHIKLFFKRSIESGPVVNVYFRNVSPEDATLVDDMLVSSFNKYVENNKKDFKEQDIYQREKSNIAKMNGLKHKGSYTNYANDFTSMDHLKRHGEYNSIYEEKVFNNWLFTHGQLIEQTINTLSGYSVIEKRRFIISLFLYCSSKLNGIDLDGCLSFKSHYIGFMSASKKMIPYHEMFLKQFDKEKKENHFRWQCDPEQGYYLSMDQAREELLNQWHQGINSFVADIDTVEKLNMGLLSGIHMLKFRSVSTFHKKAFAVKNISYYMSREFQAYRRVVNLMYLILPTLGFNTVDRLYCSLCLLKVIEGDILK